MLYIRTPQYLALNPQEVNEDEDGSEFEVVFISSDDDKNAAKHYLAEMHGNWVRGRLCVHRGAIGYAEVRWVSLRIENFPCEIGTIPAYQCSYNRPCI